jgi:hypothetical protein
LTGLNNIEGDDGIVRCRRRVLDAYLDGREGREGCEDGEERCNVYRGLDEEIEEMEEGSSKDSSNTGAIEAIESEGEIA